jgi:AcrR family transcriptional regulator
MVVVPNRDRRAERREATRREILDAAWLIARQEGLPAVTLRAVAARVGMRAPSLYSHFASKNAIYDAMFRQAWTEFDAAAAACYPGLPASPRAALAGAAKLFFDFSVSDLARYQLMNQRTIPGFEPSPESFAPAERALDRLRSLLAGLGLRDPAALDLYTAVIGGLIDQQLANDPGGTRWQRLLGRAVGMYATEMGLPAGPETRQ